MGENPGPLKESFGEVNKYFEERQRIGKKMRRADRRGTSLLLVGRAPGGRNGQCGPPEIQFIILPGCWSEEVAGAKQATKNSSRLAG